MVTSALCQEIVSPLKLRAARRWGTLKSGGLSESERHLVGPIDHISLWHPSEWLIPKGEFLGTSVNTRGWISDGLRKLDLSHRAIANGWGTTSVFHHNNNCSVIQNLSREYKNHIKCRTVPKNADHIAFLYPNLHFQCWILFCWLWIRTLKGPTVEMLPQRNSCILKDKTRESPKDSFTLTNITMNLILLASKILKNVKVFHKRDKTLMGWN